ncbi:ABC transporter ATP-binding protein/permease [Mycobacterium sp. ITM-2016-00317]|uniref:ABC transporter ATP-binding protein/permease n=1 Tax=Mycobacterium sp. ITM-2016-00317 TaxID=2099694 RepID=UPI000D489BFB|nr:ABC transporter ATP-binding protein/permease [Mycobacterium sp. ITM-2016-00317]WNG90156.1 ABC transporter ATP-binding protein/permease [Mycobacterium sp. ITM-2016-00317]
METFTPTRDWGNELWTSLWWVAQGWAYAAVATMVVLFLLVRFTTWGHQFWRITRGYFTGPESVVVWLWLAGMLLLVMTSVRLSVLFTYQGSDMMTGFQVIAGGLSSGDDAVRQSGADGFWLSMWVFAILAVLNVSLIMIDLLVTQRFMLRWRTWLTDQLTGDWLDGKAYYRARFIDSTIDNPDQRIQTDIDIFTTGVGPLPNRPNNTSGSTLLFGAVSSIASMISFTLILWNLSGPVTLPFVGFELPKAMFWIGILYILFATVIAFWIGRPIIGLSFNNEKFNAAFRYALVRLRDASEAVAFYRGELAERTGLRRRFRPIVENYKKYVNRMAGFLGWNLSITQAQELIPYIVQFSRFYNGEITLGQLSQTGAAFRAILSGLSFFRNAYDDFAGYRAAIIRLYGLVIANEEGRALPCVACEESRDGSVEIDDVEVHTPDGKQLVSPLDLTLEPGDALMITGPSGSGKTTLLRSLGKLWPYASGTIKYPMDTNQTMFLSQLPYVPLGDLRTVVAYPNNAEDVDDAALRDVLNRVALPHLVNRLDEEQDWAKVLSPGEQQRIAFARILLTKPRAVFLDESTSALDEGLELMLYQLVRAELPDTILVSVSHRSTVEQHHTRELKLLGDGRWELSELEPQPT